MVNLRFAKIEKRQERENQFPFLFRFRIFAHVSSYKIDAPASSKGVTTSTIKSVATASMAPVYDTSEKNACLAKAVRLEKAEWSSGGRHKA
jgi:hypothetical protein